MAKDVFDAVAHYIKTIQPIEINQGLVLSAEDGRALITLDGSTQPVNAMYNRDMLVQPKEQCVVIRSKRSPQWVIIAHFGTPRTGMQNANPGQSQLSPPSSITVTSMLGCVSFAWDVPPNVSLSFEVQTALLVDKTDAQTVQTSRNSTYLYRSGGIGSETVYVRVRAVNQTAQTSSWTDWYTGVAVTIGEVIPSTLTLTITSPSFYLSGKVCDVLPGEVIESIEIEVLTPLNGNIPSVNVGTVADEDLYSTSLGSTPSNISTVACRYDVEIDETIVTAGEVWLYLIATSIPNPPYPPGGNNTAGSVRATVYVRKT